MNANIEIAITIYRMQKTDLCNLSMSRTCAIYKKNLKDLGLNEKLIEQSKFVVEYRKTRFQDIR